MSLFAIASMCLAALSLGAWLLLVFGWGAFWQIRRFDADGKEQELLPSWPTVIAIVPARSEAQTIQQTVTSLLRQDYPGELSIVVVDDHSEDDTADLARQAMEGATNSISLEVISAPLLPDGWTGKLSALNAGVEAASNVRPEFFWFTDADVVHAPDTLRRVVSRAQCNNCDLTSLMVLLKTSSFTERFLIPPFVYFFLMLYPPVWTAAPDSRTAGAAGGCVLLRRSALERIGGLAALRSEVIDDCALARAVKSSGGKVWMGLTRLSYSLRSYSGFSEIRDMIARTAFTQLSYSVAALTGTLVGMVLLFVLPVLLTFSRQPYVWHLALAAWCLMSVSLMPALNFYRVSPIFSLLLPVVALFYCYATLLSAVRYWLGRGGQWKGRNQAQSHRRSNV
jgi:hopene-associated glycosyltransferase HpnB